jgi:2'-5' RNA ligase
MSSPRDASHFFIALLPPPDVQEFANQVVAELGDRYQTCTAKAPPHVTLFPPFEWHASTAAQLDAALRDFAAQQSSIPVTLSGFGAFPPRVLYINVLKTAELLHLQAELLCYLESTLAIVDPKSKTRPFAPHLTVASRNINGAIFKAAWADLRPRPVEFTFVSNRLTLLNHDGHQWLIRDEFLLSAPSIAD